MACGCDQIIIGRGQTRIFLLAGWQLRVCDNATVHPKELPGNASSHHSVSAFDRFKSVQNSTLGARDVSTFHNSQVSAFSSGRTHQNTHKIEGTVISSPHFRGARFSQVSVRTGSTVLTFQGVLTSGVSLFQDVLISRVSLLQGCPYFRGVLISGCPYFRVSLLQGFSLFQGCLYFRGVLIS